MSPNPNGDESVSDDPGDRAVTVVVVATAAVTVTRGVSEPEIHDYEHDNDDDDWEKIAVMILPFWQRREKIVDQRSS